MDRKSSRPAGIGLGYFDGLHRGHMELVRSLVHHCAELGFVPTVLTFDRHPSATASTGRPAGRPAGALMSLEEKTALLREAGVEEILVQQFDAAFASLSALRFLDEVLYDGLGVRLVVVGHDYRFGKGRTGDVALLEEWGRKKGVDVLVMDPVKMGGTLVKSTTIRSLVSAGRTMEAASLLGRCYSLSGIVEHGKGLGRRLGFPTANFHAPGDRVLPAIGIYRSRARMGNRTYEAVTSLGYRPTIENEAAELLVETCLFDVDSDLYGQPIEVLFLERIREEERFDDLESLTAQMRKDVAKTREMHRNDESGWRTAVVQGIPVEILRSSRFRTALCSVAVKVPLRRETASRNALLLRVLASSCARLPDRTEVAAELDALYGAEIHSSVQKEGDLQTLVFTADALTRWTDGTSPFEAASTLLFEMLLTPALDADGGISASIVEDERQNLLAEIASRENDRTRYCIDRCTEAFCGDAPHGIEEDGEEREVRSTTRESLLEAYETCFRDGFLQVHLAGDPDPHVLEAILASVRRLAERFPTSARLSMRPGVVPAPLPAPAPDPSGQPREVVERKKVEQARVCLAYEGGPAYYSMDAAVMTVLNSMLGGDAHSLLFEKVREEEGLAYSIFSAPLRFQSGILLCAGVPVDRTDEAVRSMRRQVEAIAEGTFPDRIFDSALRMTESSVRTRRDDLASLAAMDMSGLTVGRRLRIEENLLILRCVTRERVVAMARRLKERVRFLQIPEGEER